MKPTASRLRRSRICDRHRGPQPTLMHFGDHPFRFTGPLFLDSDHEPSRADGTGGSPDRASVWEVHPLYNIEICKFTSKNKCDPSNPANKKSWVTLDTWVGEENQ